MGFSQRKYLVLSTTVLALVGCGTVSNTSEYVNSQSLQVASMLGDAQPGDRVSLSAQSGLSMDSVVVDQTYFAASGRKCRRLRTIDGTPIQRVACKGRDGVWSLARDLRPISSIAPTASSTNAVKNTDKPDQLLVPSTGSLMLLNKVNGLSSDTTSHDSVAALATGAVESLMQAGETLSQDSLANSSMPMPASAEPVLVVPASYTAEKYSAPVAQTSSDISIATESVPSITEPSIIVQDAHAEQYAVPIGKLPPEVDFADASMMARAESLILTGAEYSEQVNAQPLVVNLNPIPSLNSAEPVSMGAAEPDTETISRTLHVDETLWSFAKRTTGDGQHWQSIARINGISDVTTIAIGAQLLIPVELVGKGG